MPDFWRAANDNDYDSSTQKKSRIWLKTGKIEPVSDIKISIISGNPQIIFTKKMLNGDALYITMYDVNDEGNIKIKNKFDAIKGNYPTMMRFGNQMVLPKEFNNLKWYGGGPQESYWDRKQGKPLGNTRERWKNNIIHTFVRKNQETRQMFVGRV